MKNPLAERFWSNVDKTADCWEWQGYRLRSGYGGSKLNGRTQYAHRIAWELTFGPIPKGFYVLHHCDNHSCVNPSHLWLGTQAENQADMAKKACSAQGESNGSSKLKAIEVLKIRALSSEGKTQELLARLFGISQSQISRIVLHQNWTRI